MNPVSEPEVKCSQNASDLRATHVTMQCLPDVIGGATTLGIRKEHFNVQLLMWILISTVRDTETHKLRKVTAGNMVPRQATLEI